MHSLHPTLTPLFGPHPGIKTAIDCTLSFVPTLKRAVCRPWLKVRTTLFCKEKCGIVRKVEGAHQTKRKYAIRSPPSPPPPPPRRGVIHVHLIPIPFHSAWPQWDNNCMTPMSTSLNGNRVPSYYHLSFRIHNYSHYHKHYALNGYRVRK